jgi:cytochrome P450
MTTTATHSPTTGDIGSVLDVDSHEPWEWFAKVRHRGGVVWDEGADTWLVTSHELLKDFLQDDETFTRPEKVADTPQVGRFIEHVPEGTDPEYWTALIARLTQLRSGSKRNVDPVIMDGAEHKHVHRWWIKTFSPRVLERWRENTIRPLMNDQLDKLGTSNHADLCEAFVNPVVPRVMAGVTGGRTDEEWALELSDWTLKFIATRTAQHDAQVPVELIETAVNAGEKLNEMLRPIVTEKRDNRGDDLISIVWNDAEDLFQPDLYGEYDEDDVMSVAVAIGRGGLSTVRSGVSCIVYTLLREPELQAQLRAGGDEAVKKFVEEVLRLYGPVDVRPRVATRDIEFGGVSIRKGESVTGLQISANRDEAKYACPAHVDMERGALRNHYSFGKGPRSCPGHAFGRMVMAEATSVLLERYADLRLDADAAPPVYKGLMLRSWEPLNAVLSPA